MRLLKRLECWWRKQHIYCWYACESGPFGICLICGKVTEEVEEDKNERNLF